VSSSLIVDKCHHSPVTYISIHIMSSTNFEVAILPKISPFRSAAEVMIR
jgi:hypothetical protein